MERRRRDAIIRSFHRSHFSHTLHPSSVSLSPPLPPPRLSSPGLHPINQTFSKHLLLRHEGQVIARQFSQNLHVQIRNVILFHYCLESQPWAYLGGFRVQPPPNESVSVKKPCKCI